MLTFAVIGAVALAAVFASHPRQYISDFRFEVAWDPVKSLALVHHARDAEGGFGRPAELNRGLLTSLFF